MHESLIASPHFTQGSSLDDVSSEVVGMKEIGLLELPVVWTIRLLEIKPTAPEPQSPASTPSVAVELTPQQKRILKKRWQLLEPLVRNGHAPQECEFEDRAAEARDQGIRCSARTLRRYYQAWLRAGKDRLALAPTNGGRRRRYRTRRNALLERHPRLLAISR